VDIAAKLRQQQQRVVKLGAAAQLAKGIFALQLQLPALSAAGHKGPAVSSAPGAWEGSLRKPRPSRAPALDWRLLAEALTRQRTALQELAAAATSEGGGSVKRTGTTRGSGGGALQAYAAQQLLRVAPAAEGLLRAIEDAGEQAAQLRSTSQLVQELQTAAHAERSSHQASGGSIAASRVAYCDATLGRLSAARSRARLPGCGRRWQTPWTRPRARWRWCRARWQRCRGSGPPRRRRTDAPLRSGTKSSGSCGSG
jgi:hypothetical protein